MPEERHCKKRNIQRWTVPPRWQSCRQVAPGAHPYTRGDPGPQPCIKLVAGGQAKVYASRLAFTEYQFAWASQAHACNGQSSSEALAMTSCRKPHWLPPAQCTAETPGHDRGAHWETPRPAQPAQLQHATRRFRMGTHRGRSSPGSNCHVLRHVLRFAGVGYATL